MEFFSLDHPTSAVQGAHHILGPFALDSDLRRRGLKLAERGGKDANKRAVIAVAREVGSTASQVVISGEVYEPLRNNHRVMSDVA
jgi:transposase